MRLATEEAPPPETTVTVDEAAEHLMRHLEAIDRRPSTLATYRSLFRNHLEWSMEEVPLERVTRSDVEVVDRVMRRKSLKPKTRVNALKLLSEIFAYAKRQGWCQRNPCEQVQLPHIEPTSDIRFLTEDELVALLEAVDVEKEPLGHTDWAMFLTAALTGLRQSELLALEWRDIDFPAERVRVRRSNVRGNRGRPKSRYSSRSVPMAPQVAVALRRHWTAPSTGIASILSSDTPAPAQPLAPRQSTSGSRRRCGQPRCARSALRICATPSGPGSRQKGCRFGLSRSGWDTKTSGQRRSTPPTNRGSTMPKWPANLFPK